MLLVGICCDRPAQATTYAYQTPHSLLAQADVVVRGKVRDIEKEGAPRYIIVNFDVDEVASGTLTTSTPLRLLYHRILRQPNAEIRNGDRMLLILERLGPGRSPYYGKAHYDYSFAGRDSEGAYFLRGGKVDALHGVWGNHIPAAVLESERKFLDWLLNRLPAPVPSARE